MIDYDLTIAENFIGLTGESIEPLLIVIDDAPPELYNLKEDIGEKNNISEKNRELGAELLKAYDEWYSDVSSQAAKFELEQSK